MISVIIRTILIYILIVGFMRITGKRQIGELQLSELVTTLLLSEIAAIPITDISTPLLHSVIPLILLISVEIIISFVVTKSPTSKKLFDGAPSFLIRRGCINQSELRRQRISVEEFLGALRLKDIASPCDAEYAILEQNGQLSVLKKPDADTCGIAHPLIIDGSVNLHNLSSVGLSLEWLRDHLAAAELKQKDIFILTVDDAGKISVILKE